MITSGCMETWTLTKTKTKTVLLSDSRSIEKRYIYIHYKQWTMHAQLKLQYITDYINHSWVKTLVKGI